MDPTESSPGGGPVARIVYYGPGRSGKTASLLRLADAYGAVDRLTVLDTSHAGDHCEFLPLDWVDPPLRLHLIAVPGRLQRADERRRLLSGAAGVVFVADGRPTRQDANLVLLDELGSHLAALCPAPATFPLVLQYNHRDLPEAVPMADMDRLLNGRGGPTVAASAATGEGVDLALQRLVALLP